MVAKLKGWIENPDWWQINHGFWILFALALLLGGIVDDPLIKTLWILMLPVHAWMLANHRAIKRESRILDLLDESTRQNVVLLRWIEAQGYEIHREDPKRD